jgi:alpha-galactosidase
VILGIVLLQSPWRWTQRFAVNTWRIALDEVDGFDNMLQIADADAPLAPYAGKEGWNDPDMLRVGLGDMNSDEYRTQMTLWAMLSAPLLAGADLRSISPSDLAILTNPDVIAINQDSDAQQASRIQTGVIDVWAKKLNVGQAVAVVNRSDRSLVFAVDPGELGVNATRAYEVWTKQIIALPHSITIPPHGCVLLKIS